MSTLNLPDLGEGLAEAEILEWHVKIGDQVRVDQPMVSLETAKAVVEVPAPFSGMVVALRGGPGDIVLTGAPLIDFESVTVVGSMPPPVEEHLATHVLGTAARSANSDRPADNQRTHAVPAARALAKQLGLDVAALSGSGRGGLITVEDVLAAVPPNLARPQAQHLPVGGGAAQPLRGARRAMAHSMTLSRDQISGSTVCDDADIHSWPQRGDYMQRLMRAMVAAWRIEPALNAWYDAASLSRILVEHVDLAVAVDTPGGLIVPVVRNIEKKSAAELRAALAERKEAAHSRRTTPEDLCDFTLMLSNFGTLAGRYGIPLVVPPAVAILGAGKVREDAVVVAGSVQAHRRMPLSLSFDHRCVTGGEACRFLAAVIADLEKSE